MLRPYFAPTSPVQESGDQGIRNHRKFFFTVTCHLLPQSPAKYYYI
ncbi:hypothetical protein [Sphaerospermopsis sp. FACHB-1194]|nr:hypothetical protein [Sphaerospermopsis sp. FACHB-1194]MBD2147134.1 hypothetical protein [Sphaerospermopsis sp. FACHB-1194]